MPVSRNQRSLRSATIKTYLVCLPQNVKTEVPCTLGANRFTSRRIGDDVLQAALCEDRPHHGTLTTSDELFMIDFAMSALSGKMLSESSSWSICGRTNAIDPDSVPEVPGRSSSHHVRDEVLCVKSTRTLKPG